MSSLPLTMCFRPGAKSANIQYVRLVCPLYVFTHLDVWVFHRRIVESCVLARMNLELGVNLMWELLGVSKTI